MVDCFKTEGFGSSFDCSTNSAHSEDPQSLALRVMAEVYPLLEVSLSKRQKAGIELTQCSEQKEYSQICCRVCNRIWSIGDFDSASYAGIDVDLIVAYE